MSIASNFPTAGALIQDPQTGLIATPYERLSIADLLPWQRQPQTALFIQRRMVLRVVLPSGTSQAIRLKLITISFRRLPHLSGFAGIVVVDREMLDDITLVNWVSAVKIIGWIKESQKTA